MIYSVYNLIRIRDDDTWIALSREYGHDWTDHVIELASPYVAIKCQILQKFSPQQRHMNEVTHFMQQLVRTNTIGNNCPHDDDFHVLRYT